jgi:ankyrin repeat protein
VQVNAFLESTDVYIPSPLFIAVEQGHYLIAEFLLKSGADANACFMPLRQTPLSVALQKNDNDLVNLLCSYGAHT